MKFQDWTLIFLSVLSLLSILGLWIFVSKGINCKTGKETFLPGASPKVFCMAKGQPSHICMCDSGKSVCVKNGDCCSGSGNWVPDEYGVNAYRCTDGSSPSVTAGGVSCFSDYPKTFIDNINSFSFSDSPLPGDTAASSTVACPVGGSQKLLDCIITLGSYY